MIGLIGAKVAVESEKSLAASKAVDFVARNEFDFTILDIAKGVPLAEVDGISWRDDTGEIIHNRDRAVIGREAEHGGGTSRASSMIA